MERSDKIDSAGRTSRYGPGEGFLSGWRCGWMPIQNVPLDSTLLSLATSSGSSPTTRVFSDNRDAPSLPATRPRGIAPCDYILSGIPSHSRDKKNAPSVRIIRPSGLAARYYLSVTTTSSAPTFHRAESAIACRNIPMFVTFSKRLRRGRHARLAAHRESRPAPCMSVARPGDRDSRVRCPCRIRLYGLDPRAYLIFQSRVAFRAPIYPRAGLVVMAPPSNHDLGCRRKLVRLSSSPEEVERASSMNISRSIFSRPPGTSNEANASRIISNRCCIWPQTIGARAVHLTITQMVVEQRMIPSAIPSAAEQ